MSHDAPTGGRGGRRAERGTGRETGRETGRLAGRGGSRRGSRARSRLRAGVVVGVVAGVVVGVVVGVVALGLGLGLPLVVTGSDGQDSSETTGRTSTDGARTASASPSTGPSTGQTAVATSIPPAPEAGSCHRLTWEQALAPTASNVPGSCRTSTSLTFHVGKLRKDSEGRRVLVDSEAAQAQIRTTCPRQLRKFLGGTAEQRRLSVLTTIWFTPTLDEEARGADWFRCDVVAPGPDNTLLKVSKPMRNSIGTPKAAKYELCASGRPGKKSFTHVPCAKKHTWRAVATVDLPGKAHPGRKAVAARMEEPCTDAATAVATDATDVRWSQEGPTRKQWKAGQRYGYCWVPTA